MAFATGTVSFDLSATSLGDVNWQVVLAVVLVAFVAALVALWRVRRLRQRVAPVLRSAWSAFAELMRSPSRAIGLFGTQVLIQLMWGLILWAGLYAVGSPLGLMACTLVVVTTSLFQGIVPVPGGIGVSEALMVGLLVPLGVASDAAMAATIVWRVATFYLRRQRASSPPGGSNVTATSDPSHDSGGSNLTSIRSCARRSCSLASPDSARTSAGVSRALSVLVARAGGGAPRPSRRSRPAPG